MENMNTPIHSCEPKLVDQVRERIRIKHYSIRTETQYVDWIKFFIFFYGTYNTGNSSEDCRAANRNTRTRTTSKECKQRAPNKSVPDASHKTKRGLRPVLSLE